MWSLTITLNIYLNNTFICWSLRDNIILFIEKDPKSSQHNWRNYAYLPCVFFFVKIYVATLILLSYIYYIVHEVCIVDRAKIKCKSCELCLAWLLSCLLVGWFFVTNATCLEPTKNSFSILSVLNSSRNVLINRGAKRSSVKRLGK